jgi:large subunit ribosomal protein L3
LPLLKGILGRKLGMTQLFEEDGRAVPVTAIKAGPCVVVQKREVPGDGHHAVQLGFEEVKESKVNKPSKGHFAKAGVEAMRYLCEFRLAEAEGLEPGAKVTVSMFKPGERVAVTGVSKGRGFAGGVKRYGFHGGPASHGSMSHRRPASGGGTDAARVFPGTRKPGHMGAARVTIRGLQVVQVDEDKNLLVVKGAVPGPVGGLVRVTQPLGRPKRSHKVKIIS